MFKNMKIGARLALGFSMVLVLLIVVALIGIARLSELNRETELIVKDRYPKTILANTVIGEINKIARAMRNTVILSDPEQAKKELVRIEEARKVILESLGKLEKTITSDKGKEML